MKSILFFVFMFVLFVMAAICLFVPRRVQEYAKASVNRGITSKINFLKEYVASPSYIIDVRRCGVGAFLGFAFMLWILIRNWSLFFLGM